MIDLHLWQRRSGITRRVAGRGALSVMLFAGFSVGHLAHAQVETVTVGITNAATDAGFFIADKKGYFRAEGIEIKTTAFASAAGMVAPLGRGQLDVGAGTVSAGLYNAVEQGVQLRIIADKGSVTDKLEYSRLVVRKDLADSGRYKTLADLKGMTIAAASPGSGSESSVNEALKKGGLKYGDVKVVYMGFPQMLAALINKGIDAAQSNEPTLTRGLRDGITVARESNRDLSRAADRRRTLFRGFCAEAPRRGSEIHQSLYPGRARLQRRHSRHEARRAQCGGDYLDPH